MHQNKDTPNLLHSYQYGLIKFLTLLSFESSTMVLDVQCEYKIQICKQTKMIFKSLIRDKILAESKSHIFKIVLGKYKQLTMVY